MLHSEKVLFRKFPFHPKRKVSTNIPGQFHSRTKGQGQDFHGLRPYEYGDDSRKINWKHYAKTGELAVREEIAERNMRIWIAQDLSRSMEFGAKPEIVNAFFAFAGYLARDGINSVGLIGFSDKLHFIRKPRAGSFQKPEKCTDPKTAKISLASKVLRKHSRPGDIIFLVSDFFFGEDVEKELRQFAFSQELIPIVIRDPREKMRATNARISSIDMETEHSIGAICNANLEAYDAELRGVFNRLFLDFLWIEGREYTEAMQAILEWLYRRTR